MNLLYPDFNSAYIELNDFIKTCGTPLDPRGLKCKEVRPASFTLLNPHKSLYVGVKRRLNYRFFAVETVGYLGGRSDKDYMDLLCQSNQNMRKFEGKDGTLEGAYGPVLQKSLYEAQKILEADPHTRQCVCSLWSPGINDKISVNTMCTCLLQFMTGDTGKLNMSVYMRSNDINWGTPYDVAAFSTIQICMASSLGMDVGTYTHIAGSLHIYVDNAPTIEDSNAMRNIRIEPEFIIPRYDDPGKCPFTHIKDRHNQWLDELFDHKVKKDCKWNTFKSTLSNDSMYWHFMDCCVRFSWKQHIFNHQVG